MNNNKTTKLGTVELECSGKWPVNPSPTTGEIPRLFYCYDTEKLLCVFSDITIERNNVKCEWDNPTILVAVWNHSTIFQKWTQEAIKVTGLDRYPYCAIDDATGTIFGGYSSVEEGLEILESNGFFEIETNFAFYIMRDGYFEPVQD